MIRKLPIYVSIIAAMVVIVMGLLLGVSGFEIIKRAVLFIALFFVIAIPVQVYLNKKVFYKKDEPTDGENGEDEDANNNIDFDKGIGDNNENE